MTYTKPTGCVAAYEEKNRNIYINSDWICCLSVSLFSTAKIILDASFFHSLKILLSLPKIKRLDMPSWGYEIWLKTYGRTKTSFRCAQFLPKEQYLSALYRENEHEDLHYYVFIMFLTCYNSNPSFTENLLMSGSFTRKSPEDFYMYFDAYISCRSLSSAINDLSDM